MTLDDAMADLDEVTAKEARREIRKHDASWDEFVADHGQHETYLPSVVLTWLGY